MPNQLVLPVSPGSLPTGFCPASYQDLLNEFSSNQSVTFPVTFTGITVSSTQPTDTTQAWLQLDSTGSPVRIYYFSQGAWLSRHPLIPGMAIPWFGTLPTFTTFDGGDANAVSAISGPMWEVVTEMAAKFPLAAGTLPSGTAVSDGDSGGEETHTLTSGEAGVDPLHRHGIGRLGSSNRQLAVESGGALSLSQAGVAIGGSGDIPASTLSDVASFGTTFVQSDVPISPPTLVGHNTMPPWYGMNWIRRTARVYYVI